MLYEYFGFLVDCILVYVMTLLRNNYKILGENARLQYARVDEFQIILGINYLSGFYFYEHDCHDDKRRRGAGSNF